MTKMKGKIRVRDFEEEDQDDAYRIWKLGMTEDLGDLFVSFYLAKKRVKITLMLLPFFGMVSGLKHGNYIGIVISLSFLLFINFYGKRKLCKYFYKNSKFLSKTTWSSLRFP